jgi:PAS domain S-box-containing protein
MKIRTRLLVLFLILGIVMSGIVFAGFEYSKHAVAETQSSHVEQKPAEIAQTLETRVGGLERTTRLWARNPAVARHGSPQQRRALSEFVDETTFDGVSVIASNGTMTGIAADLEPATRRQLVGTEFSDRRYFREAMRGQTFVSDPVRASSGNYIVTISTPIYRNGTVVGTVNAALHLQNGSFFDVVDSVARRHHGVTIRSRSGTVIYERQPDPETDLIVANTTLEETGWTVSVQGSRQVFATELQTITYRQLGGVALVLLVLGVYGWLFYARILRYHEALLDGFEALKRNEYDHRLDVEARGEWSRLVSGFNETSRTLASYERERKDRETKLRRFKRAVEATGHAVYITDTDGTIEYVNPAFNEITGYDAVDAIGENASILKSGEMSEEYYETMWATILEGEVWEEELVDRRDDGERYHAYQTIAPIPGEDGQIEAFVAIQTDITDRKQLETELRDSIQQLRVIDRVLRHNLRNDTNIIEGFARLLEEETSGATATYATRIRTTSEKLRELTNKERKITKFLSDPPGTEVIDLVEAVETVLAEVRDSHPSADVSTAFPVPPCSAHATPAIAQAVEELIENAAVHSDRERPSIEVRIERDDDVARIRVTDDGPGIPEMERRVLTGDAEIEPLYHGSGLGLWLVNLIVRQSEGTLTFDENEPRGSVVEIELPRD